MLKRKEEFKLRKDLINSVSQISDELAGKLFKHILGYVNDQNPQSDNVIVNLLFTPVEHGLIEESQKKESFLIHCREAGLKSAELRKLKLDPEQMSTNVNQRQPTSTNLEKEGGLKKKYTKKVDYEEIRRIFNETCVSLQKATLISPKRITLIDTILKTYSLEHIGTVFTMTEQSDYLSGKVQKWKASFDWLFNPNNFLKVLEGNYSNIDLQKDRPKDVNSQLRNANDAVDKFFK